MYTIKKERVKKLQEILESKNMFDGESDEDPFSVRAFKITNTFLRFVDKFVSDEVIENMIAEAQSGNYEEAASYYKALEKKGYLNIVPAICGKSDEVPSLIISDDKYLHWFRGYYFQISYTEYGDGEYNTSCFRMDYLLRCCRSSGLSGRSAQFVFVMSALTTLLCLYGRMNCWLKTESGKQTFNEFLSLSSRNECQVGKDVCLDDLMKYVDIDKFETAPSITPDDKACVLLNHDVPYAAVVSEENCIKVIKYSGEEEKWLVFTVRYPGWMAVTDDFFDEDRNVFKKAILEFILTYSGIRTNYIAMYPIKVSTKKVKPVHYNLPDRFEKFEKVQDWIVE